MSRIIKLVELPVESPGPDANTKEDMRPDLFQLFLFLR